MFFRLYIIYSISMDITVHEYSVLWASMQQKHVKQNSKVVMKGVIMEVG